MGGELRVLLVEDSEVDAALVVRELRQAGFEPAWRRVETTAELEEALENGAWDIVLADYSMPGCQGPEALQVVKCRAPELPFIVVSGQRGEGTAVTMMREGADDYILKDRLRLLGPAVRRELRQAEARRAAREAEARYRSLFETALIGLYRTTPDGKILMANQALCAMLGYDSFEALAARNLEEGGFEPEYPREEFKRVLERDGEVRGRESAWHRADGTTLWVRENARVVRDRDGRVLYYEGSVEDITDRKEMEEALRASEERYRRLFMEAPVGIFHYDTELIVTDCNDSFVRSLGSSRERLIGLDMRTLRDQRLLPALEAPLRGERGYYEGPYRATTGSAELEIVLSTAPVVDGRGRVQACVGVGRDVTREKLLERQFLQAQKMESIGRLAGGVAHDVNNVLQAMMGHLEVLIRKAKGSELAPMAEAVQRDVMRAGELTSQLLAYARQQRLRKEPLELNDLLAKFSGMLRRLVPESIRLGFSPAHVDLDVLADRVQLQQVLMNLVLNARDACGGRGSILIRLRRQRADEGFRRERPWATAEAYAVISVSDDGPGVPPELEESIFEPFFTTKEVGQGSGLGLAAVQGIVAQHGGVVELENRPGEGATFHVYLPLLEPRTAGRDHPAPEEVEGPAGNGELILAAEDDPSSRSLLCRMLEEAGYRVLAAANGLEALRIFEEHRDEIAAAVVDVVMPGLQGPDLARRLRSLRRGFPVLFASGFPTSTIGERLHGLEDLHFLTKPYQRGPLLRALRSLIEGRGAGPVPSTTPPSGVE